MKPILNFAHTLLQFCKHLEWLPPLLARIVLAAVFIGSGWGKMQDIPKVVEFFSDLGIPAPNFQAHLVAGTEFVGGILILLGLFSRLASIPLSITMVVALVTAKSEDIESFSDLAGTTEFLYILLFFFIIFCGPGLVSLDTVLRKKLFPATVKA
jgi:putative oxidoreductase